MELTCRGKHKKNKKAKNGTARKAAIIFRADTKQTAILKKAGRTKSANAIIASKALGLSITYTDKGVLYSENPDGSRIIIASAKTMPAETGIKYKKGMILHAK